MDSKVPDWFRSRRYLHFDVPVSCKKARNVVSTPSIVARHSFYPFLSFQVVTKKIKKKEKGQGFEPEIKPRPIAYAGHMDSHIYSYYAKGLSSLYEDKLEEYGLGKSVLAFRKLEKSNIEFAHEAFQSIQSMGDQELLYSRGQLRSKGRPPTRH